MHEGLSYFYYAVRKSQVEDFVIRKIPVFPIFAVDEVRSVLNFYDYVN